MAGRIDGGQLQGGVELLSTNHVQHTNRHMVRGGGADSLAVYTNSGLSLRQSMEVLRLPTGLVRKIHAILISADSK